MKKRITNDFETRSMANLKLVGAYKYSLDPTTRPTCYSFKKHGESTIYFLDFYMINTPWKNLPERLKNMWTEWILDGYLFSAQNAFFEQCIYNNILVKRYGWPPIPARRWRCTAAKAAVCALPRNLEGAAEAAGLRTKKDYRGYQAMMATCKPTKQWTGWHKLQQDIKDGKRVTDRRRSMYPIQEPPVFLEPEEAPEVFATLGTYCKIDTKAEEELDDALPDLIPIEQELWFLNQKLNWRGLRVDIPVVQKIAKIMEADSKIKLKELDILTMGLVTKPNSRKSILEFLALDDVILPDIKAKTVNDILESGTLNEDMQRLLEIRKALSKTSTKKYQTFLNRANDDNKVRDILLFHGASTGRDTGTGIQPHNFPRPLLKQKEIDYILEMLADPKCSQKTCTEWIEFFYGSISMVFSSLLRSMILPSDGKELYVADFSKIEVAVCWWLADNKPGIEVLKSGKDPYIYQAADNVTLTYEEVEAGVTAETEWAMRARQLGKAQILGCGFGMGWMKFQTTAQDQYRLKLTDEESRHAVKSYRTVNSAVPKLWEAYEQAAINAVKSGGTWEAGKCKFIYEPDSKRNLNFLWIELPSGRRLAYANPTISWRVRQYEAVEVHPVTGESIRVKKFTEPKETLEFWAVNSKTKKWNLERTWGGTLCENIVQAVARDLMMYASLRLEKAGYLFLLSVHDEGITEKEKGKGSVDEFSRIMCEQPEWADEDLVIEAKGWRGPRYKK